MMTSSLQLPPLTKLPEVKYYSSGIESSDGTQIHIHRFEPLHEGQKTGEILILHGYMEHGGRYRQLAHALAHFGLATVALDFRGHGLSQGARGFVDKFEHYLQDVDIALALLHHDNRFILGHSHGGLVALDYVQNRKPRLSGVVLSNPYLALSQPAPAYRECIAHLANRFWPSLSLPSGLDANGLSRDITTVQSYGSDPLVFQTANASWFIQCQQAQKRVKEIQAFNYPLLYIYSDADPIASPAANEALARQLDCLDKTIQLEKDAKHEVLNEQDKACLWQLLGTWCQQRCAKTVQII